jgi:hypothetical protein
VIDVNNAAVEGGFFGAFGIEDDLRMHTLANSSIAQSNFGNWSRWYQTDGATQVFRLFAGEENVRNDRPLAARVETFDANTNWNVAGGVWNEWVGRYTIVDPINAAIFQAKDQDDEDWSVQIAMNSAGRIAVTHRRPLPGQPASEMLIDNATGQSFDIRIRDNGLDYEVYFGDLSQPFTTGRYLRNQTAGDNSFTRFRWGMYVGGREVTTDGMIFVSHASVNPQIDYPAPLATDTMVSLPTDGSLRFNKNTGVVDGQGAGFITSSTTLDIGQSGSAATPYDRAAIMVFQLPDLGNVNNPFESASLQVSLTQTVTSGLVAADLYGIARRSTPAIVNSDYYGQTSAADPTAVLLEDNFLVANMELGTTLRNSLAGRDNLADFLNQQYARGAGIGDYVFLRLNTDEATAQRWSIASGNATNAALRPQLLFTLTPPEPLPGDYNGDGRVDAADYTVWRDTLRDFGPDLAADGDGNGQVDGGDYAVWRSNFGRVAGSALSVGAVAVPEPGSVVLTATMVLLGTAGGGRFWSMATKTPR